MQVRSIIIAVLFVVSAAAANAQSTFTPEGKEAAYTKCMADQPIGLEGYTLGEEGAILCKDAQNVLAANNRPITMDSVIDEMQKLQAIRVTLPSSSILTKDQMVSPSRN